MHTSSNSSTNKPLKVFHVKTRSADWPIVMAYDRDDAIAIVNSNWSIDIYKPDWLIVEEVKGVVFTEV